MNNAWFITEHRNELSACFIVLVHLNRRNKHQRNYTEVTGQQWIMHPLRGPCPGYGLWGKLGWFKDGWKNHILNRLIKRAPTTFAVILVHMQSHLQWLNIQQVTQRWSSCSTPASLHQHLLFLPGKCRPSKVKTFILQGLQDYILRVSLSVQDSTPF